uniref:Retrovirus-related Pol polyprotein from transposon 17.6 n=1 Tax=Cajanus cajan TaxID=3821 RepID=A0A151R0I7_CAJCA|nr:Retrovirus-related Pol polyprotein from transposon 17.6 [Cajanus cajan]
MVRKSSGKWRMCMDFTDLNKACSKDSYPFPNIDCLVDGASGYELLSFMDAYSGVMPFGLKNAGATYQRLMDKVLGNQLGRNVEAYMDDMVVKSKSVNRHFDDLQELFDTIGNYQLKLNPEKCSFGVQAGKFLADKALPLFQCLKKNDCFAWTNECEEAFTELKRSLASSPILTKPRLSLPLLFYISASDRAVSLVLVQEHEGSQVPIYFVSRVLQGAETRYQKIEKLALTILVTARKLRHYF